MKILLILLSFFFPPKKELPKEMKISDANNIASVPSWTSDAKGNPVLCWVEKDEAKKVYFYFAVSSDGGKTFGEKNMMPITQNLSSHAEGMPKIAFKNDGTIIALFEQKRPTEQNRFGSSLAYLMSVNGGKTWSNLTYLHPDTTDGGSHSFSDIARLPNGEIGAVWLDDKYKEGSRSVKFTQTSIGGGFGQSVVVDSTACQCCRTDIFPDKSGKIHVVYRDVLSDGSRDMSHAVSMDGGKSFSIPKLVFADNWQINACPHTGPTLAETSESLYITWFTGKEKKSGIKVCDVNSGKIISSQIREKVRFPHMTAIGENLAWTWVESFQKGDKFYSKIGLKIIYPNGKTKTQYLTPDFVDCNYPILSNHKGNILLAYEQRIGEEKQQIKYQIIDLNVL